MYHSLGMDRPAVGTHVPLCAYAAFDEDFSRRAFKFSIVRNPWDRLVSAFHYLKHVPIGSEDAEWANRYFSVHTSFAGFLSALENPMFRAFVTTWRHFMPQWYFLCDRSGRPGTDMIIRFENLEQGTRVIAERLGVPFTMARTNASPRRDYKAYYTAEGSDIVGRMYRKDIEVFGYDF